MGMLLNSFLFAVGLGVTDAFDRADAGVLGIADTGQVWREVQGTIGIVTAKAKNTAPGTQASMSVIDNGHADFDISVAIYGNSTQIIVGIFGRLTDATNYYLASYQAYNGNFSAVYLQKNVAGTSSFLGGPGWELGGGHVDGAILRFVGTADSFSVYLDGVLRIGPVTDAAWSTQTEHGIFIYESGYVTKLDDYADTVTA